VKKVLIGLVAVAFTLGMIGCDEADLISFLYDDSFAGVDGDTSEWSKTGSTVNLGKSWSLLGGKATVKGYSDKPAETLGNLYHRGTRGLGVIGGYNNQIDYQNKREAITIDFDVPHYLNSLELRSFFDETGGKEKARIEFYLDDSPYPTLILTATELYGSGGEGSYIHNFLTPPLVDYVKFDIIGSQNYVHDFSVAKLDVTSVP